MSGGGFYLDNLVCLLIEVQYWVFTLIKMDLMLSIKLSSQGKMYIDKQQGFNQFNYY